jgi:hypothetical protein
MKATETTETADTTAIVAERIDIDQSSVPPDASQKFAHRKLSKLQ